MADFIKCTRCKIRYVTDKARENFNREVLEGNNTLCLNCISEVTGKEINSHGYLVPPEELEKSNKKLDSIPRPVLSGCRPCMQKRG